MDANESFEKFAEHFYVTFGYYPLGKSDPLRPSAERILGDLGDTYSKLLKANEPQNKSDNTDSPEIALIEEIADTSSVEYGAHKQLLIFKKRAMEIIAQRSGSV